MLRTPLAALVALLVLAAAPAQAITLEQAMADPDWIGAPVQHPYWSVDGQSLYYTLKQKGTQVRDLHRIDVASGGDTIVDPRRDDERRRRRCRVRSQRARAPRSCATAMCSSATSPAAG